MVRSLAAIFALFVTTVVMSPVLTGCSGRPGLTENSDPALRKTSTQFASDAAKRFPYKLDAPRAGVAEARAQYDYITDTLEITNLSTEDWTDVEVWVNQQYVVYLPRMENRVLKSMPFGMIFNDQGMSFPTDNNKTRVEKVEIFRDGKMYDVTTKLGD